MTIYVITNKDNERFEVGEDELEAFLKQKNLRWSRLRNTCEKLERNDPRKWERDYKISDVWDDGFEFKEEPIDIQGKIDKLIEKQKSINLNRPEWNVLSSEEIYELLSSISVPSNISVERLVDNRKDCYTAILLGDEHFCYEDKPSISIVYDFITKHKDSIDEVLFGGDGIDASSLGKHLNLESEKHDLYKEMEAFKSYADKIKSIVPKAKMSIIEDNHFHLRKARFIAENPAMKNMIKDIKFEFDEITKHGKPYFPLKEYGNNLIAGIHGIFFNDVFTKNNTVNYPMDLFQFHTHTVQIYKGNNGLTSYGIPCLCKKEMAYLQGRPTRWENGFGVLNYFPKENRYTLEYCIIKNRVGVYRDEVYKI